MTPPTILALYLVVMATAMVACADPSRQTSRPGAAPEGDRSTPKPAAPAKGADAANSQEGVRQAIAAYEGALAEGDLQKIAKFWTADGDYAGPSGRVVNAREALAGGSIDPDSPRLALKTESLRMVTPDVAQEDGICEVKADGEKTDLPRPLFGRLGPAARGLAAEQLARDHRASAPGGDRLAALEWLVGEWTAEDDGAIDHRDRATGSTIKRICCAKSWSNAMAG